MAVATVLGLSHQTSRGTQPKNSSASENAPASRARTPRCTNACQRVCVSWLKSAGDDKTEVELRHTAVVPDEMWNEYGPGSVGVGWEGGVLGMALHLAGQEAAIQDRENWPFTAEGREFMRRSAEAWGEAHRRAGADEVTIARTVANTIAFYTGDPSAADPSASG